MNPIHTVGAANVTKPIAESKGAAEMAETFGQALEKAISGVEQQEKAVHELNDKFITGQNVDVHTLMIASEKAQLGLQLTVQVRNKVIEAYQEIMRTQL
ncbi:flagellar hook-basal body complex protein FliE [Paenibacillus thermotolerans]|uniref:flagellar hook-basal body complex protein FliE n=1 Tax=Paenibacillus thermotolerans TaxID=3027807 RepID=UPI0023684A98|nr:MULTISPECIES: flagellar hook-basal body complex protein FliE [unclassified Paenibacillus]